MLARLWRFADRLISLSAFFGTLALCIEVVVIIVDVIGRYFGSPLTGARDISQMAMTIIVFGGMALCDRVGGHISVDVFESSLPSFVIKLGDIVAPLIGAIIFLVLAWTIWESAALSRMLRLATNILYLPKAWFQYAAVAMCIVTAIAMLLRAAEAAFGGRHRHHLQETAI